MKLNLFIPKHNNKKNQQISLSSSKISSIQGSTSSIYSGQEDVTTINKSNQPLNFHGTQRDMFSYEVDKNSPKKITIDELKKQNQELMKSLGIITKVKPVNIHPEKLEDIHPKIIHEVPTNMIQMNKEHFIENEKIHEKSKEKIPKKIMKMNYFNSNSSEPNSNFWRKFEQDNNSSLHVTPYSCNKSLINPFLINQAEISNISRKKVRKVECDYFEFNQFDEFKASMIKKIKQVDIRNKIIELKGLAHTVDDLANNNSLFETFESQIEKNISAIFQKEYENPLYKQLQLKSADEVKRLRSQQEDSIKKHYIDNHQKINDYLDAKPILSSEFLNEQGISKQSHINDMESIQLSEKNNFSPLYPPTFANSLNAPSQTCFKDNQAKLKAFESVNVKNALEIATPRTSAAFDGIQLMTMISNLQFFLTQNLKETLELKELMKNGDLNSIKVPNKELYDSPYLFENSMQETKFGLDHQQPQQSSPTNHELYELEKKMVGNESQRLINKISLLTKQIEDTRKYQTYYTSILDLLQSGQKFIKVKASNLITTDIDFTNLTIEQIQYTYHLQPKYLLLKPQSLCFFNEELIQDEQKIGLRLGSEIELGEELGIGMIQGLEKGIEIILNNYDNPKNELLFSDIENIISIEILNANIFLIKLYDKSRSLDNSKSDIFSNSKPNNTNRNKMKPYEGIINFYLIQIIDKNDYMLWDHKFFIINLYVQFNNMSIIFNNPDIINSLSIFIKGSREDNISSIKKQQKELMNNINNDGSMKDYVPSPSSITKVNIGLDGTKSDNQSLKLTKKIVPKLQLNKMSNSPVGIDDDTKKNSEFNQLNTEDSKIDHIPSEIKVEKDKDKEKSKDKEESIKIDQKSIMSDESSSNLKISKQSSGLSINKNNKKLSILESEQNQIIMTIKYLQKGETFLKFGKWGSPHEKHVRLSEDCLFLEWRTIGGGKNSFNEIEIKSIQNVVEYDKSPYFSKKKMDDPDKKLCFSILGTKRNLDLLARNLAVKTAFIEAIKTFLACKKENIDQRIGTNLLLSEFSRK